MMHGRKNIKKREVCLCTETCSVRM